MKKAVRALALALAVFVLAAGSLFALGGGERESAAAKPRAVKLYGYLIGSPPAGLPEVMAELNRKLKKDLNCTMEINYINWADRLSRYPLVLAAGEDIDWIFTANWCLYTQQAVRGAFLELDEGMLRRYMPRHFPAVPKEGWQEARVDGKIYMVPTSTPDRKVPIFLLRGDLRKKYLIPEITKLSGAETYFHVIHANEPGMIPMNIESGYDLTAAFSAVRNEYCPPFNWLISSSVPFIYNYEAARPRVLTELDGVYGIAFAKAAKVMKSWYDKGYFNRNPFANKVRSMEAFAQGKSAVAFGNSQDIQGTIAKSEEQGYVVDIVPALSSTGTYPADPYINNGFALAADTKNAEKTLAAMDLIMEDPSYDYLVYFGIEGRNYVLRNGTVDLPEGLTADKNTYPPDVSGFWFTNKDIFKPLASWPSNYIALRSNLKKMLAVTPYAAFSFVPDRVKTQFANVTQVWQQYALPLQIVTEDVDREMARLKDKLDAAGMGDVIRELQKQMDDFAATIKHTNLPPYTSS
jgi:putative aldouronate transport system substrate-binding protein